MNGSAQQSDDSALMRSRILIERGTYEDAAHTLRDYLSTHVRSGDAHFLLGYVLYREARARESLAEYTFGAQFRTPDANDLAIVAMDYLLLHDYSDADKWLSMAVSWRPQNGLYWYYLGRTKYNENRFEESIQALNKCLQIRPKDLRAEYNLGLAYAGMGRDLEARAAYNLAIEWENESAQRDPQPYLNMGSLLLEQAHPDQALPYLQKAITIDARNPRLQEQLGRAYEELGQLSKAESALSEATQLAPLVSSLHFELARIYQKEGFTARARDEFARCAALNAAHSSDAAETPNPDPGESFVPIPQAHTP